jgi:hypothetical protein
MRNYELLMAVYDRCPDPSEREYTIDQYFDRCLDIREMIERERPELKDGQSEYPDQQEAGIDY